MITAAFAVKAPVLQQPTNDEMCVPGKKSLLNFLVFKDNDH